MSKVKAKYRLRLFSSSHCAFFSAAGAITVFAALTTYFHMVGATAPPARLSTAGMSIVVTGDTSLFELNGGKQLLLRFEQLNSDGQPQSMSVLSRASDPSRVELTYANGVNYWFKARPSAIEQGFTLQHPLGRNLVFRWRVSGNLVPKYHQKELVFTDGNVPLIKEWAFHAYDKNSRQLPVRLEFSDDVLNMSVDMSEAEYPVVVDPTFSLVGSFSTPAETVPGFGVPTWYAGGDSAIALSKDGHMAIIGDASWMYLNSSTSDANGRAYIYSDSGGSWNQVAALDDPDGFNIASTDQFGNAAALDAAGTVAVVGSEAYLNDGYRPGKVFVYEYSNGNWQLPQVIHNPDVAYNFLDGFGNALAISDDGVTLLVGAAGTTSNGTNGDVYVYSNLSGNWQLTATIPNPLGQSAGSFGGSIAIADNGSIAAIAGNGKVYLYTLTNGSWTKTAEIDDPDTFAVEFGQSLGMSDDGNTIIVPAIAGGVNGGPDNDISYIFENLGGTWTLAASIPDPDGNNINGWGHKVALSGDGSTAAIGSRAATTQYSNQCGKTYVYARSGNAWSLQQEIDNPTAGKIAEYLGTPAVPATLDFGYVGIGLSRDGQVALIGSGGDLNTTDDYLPITSGFDYVYSLNAQSPPAPTISNNGSGSTGSSGGSSSKSTGGGGGGEDGLLVLAGLLALVRLRTVLSRARHCG